MQEITTATSISIKDIQGQVIAYPELDSSVSNSRIGCTAAFDDSF